MRRREAARALDLRERQAEERRQPRGDAAGRIVRFVDGRQEGAEVLRLLGLEEAILLVERVGHACGAERPAHLAPLAPRARQDEEVAVLEGAAVEPPGPRRVRGGASLSRDPRAEVEPSRSTLRTAARTPATAPGRRRRRGSDPGGRTRPAAYATSPVKIGSGAS